MAASEPPILPLSADALVLRLRAWYGASKRRLPWRDTPTPYRVWVSEIMLQQTQVATVIPYFERFIAAFPDVRTLAAAPEEGVLQRWSGLGYYRRARMLHAAAREVVLRFGGELPDTVDALVTLPGIGRYTAGAIASIAFGRKAALIDGNVQRVLARLTAFDAVVDAGPGLAALWALAEAVVPDDDPSSHNQALMELGALVCTPKSPSCAECPLREACRAHRQGAPDAFPKKKARSAAQPVWAVAGCLTDGARPPAVLVARRPSDVLLGGLWELPSASLEHARAARKPALVRHFNDALGIDVAVDDHLASLSHQFTHRSLSLDIYRVRAGATRLSEPRLTFYTDARWVPLDGAGDAVPLSTLTRKVLAAVAPAAVRP